MSSAIVKKIERVAPWMVKDGKLSWVARFSAICFVCILIPVLLFHRWLGLEDFGKEGHVGIAAVVALFGMIAIGIGLMALVFYSNRSGLDDSVYDAHIADEKDEKTDKKSRTS